MYTINFTLKQHTPIIHFQHDQEGATLRATEVKPKLDRFIIEKVFNNDFEKCKVFLSGYNNQKPNSLQNKFKKESYRSLDYILTIGNVHSLKYILKRGSKFPCFFGDMGDDYVENEKALVISNELICCKIKTYSDSLANKIANCLLSFFSWNNFGTRQSKGFGSFYIDESSSYLKEYKIDYKLPELKFHFTIHSLKTKKWELNYHHLFSLINLFYKTLRQGINEKARGKPNIIQTSPDKILSFTRKTNFYFKPLIFQYAKDVLKVQWDKRSIKEYFLNKKTLLRKPDKTEARDNNLNRDYDKIQEDALLNQITIYGSDVLTFTSPTSTLHLDVKDLFGLSSLELWKSYGRSVSKDNSFKDPHNGQYKNKNKSDDSKVDRFKSPIIFKIIIKGNDFEVYFDCVDIHSGFLSELFNISFGSIQGLTLQIPSSFDFKDFFNYILNKTKFDIDTHVDSAFKNYTKNEYFEGESYEINFFESLKSIYTQIQK